MQRQKRLIAIVVTQSKVQEFSSEVRRVWRVRVFESERRIVISDCSNSAIRAPINGHRKITDYLPTYDWEGLH